MWQPDAIFLVPLNFPILSQWLNWAFHWVQILIDWKLFYKLVQISFTQVYKFMIIVISAVSAVNKRSLSVDSVLLTVYCVFFYR